MLKCTESNLSNFSALLRLKKPIHCQSNNKRNIKIKNSTNNSTQTNVPGFKLNFNAMNVYPEIRSTNIAMLIPGTSPRIARTLPLSSACVILSVQTACRQNSLVTDAQGLFLKEFIGCATSPFCFTVCDEHELVQVFALISRSFAHAPTGLSWGEKFLF